MMKKIIRNIITALIIAATMITSYGAADDRSDVQKVFGSIEEGIAKGQVRLVTSYFDSETYISLLDVTSGYYSVNQSYYLLEDFFKVYRPISFKINSVITDSIYPYATGVLKYDNSGRRNTAQVYVSLKYANNEWRIVHLTIN